MPRITKSSIKTFYINVNFLDRNKKYTYSCDVSDLKEGEILFVVNPDGFINPVEMIEYTKKPSYKCKPILNRIQLALLDDYKTLHDISRCLTPDEIKEVLDL